MVHERFDLERWIAEFPLARLRQEARDIVSQRRKEMPREYRDEAAFERHVRLMMPCGEIVTSPIHVVVNEQLRREACGGTRATDAVTTDIFVMAEGEPPRRDVTKVGGLPYWPIDRAWPRARDGAPAVFLGQISFLDSHDLVDGAPGDLLLVFDLGEAWRGIEPDDLHFEWVRRRDDTLISHTPRTGESPRAVYGVIFRTFDLPDVPVPFNAYRYAERLSVIQATKIGGLPPWTQSPEHLPGRYIATLGSVHPAHGKPYPFLNVAEPLHTYGCEHLMWGDVGNLYVFLQSDGSVLGTIDCY